MRKAVVVLGGLFLCFSLFRVGAVVAEEGQESTDTGWKQQLSDDRQQLKEQRQEIKGNLEAAKDEEKQLRQRIAAAFQANDLQTVAQLKEELRAMHHENIQGLQQDKQALQADKQELKNDVQEARQAGDLPFKKDWDNNPPGPRGGEGTNWENPPGPKGGPGTSPDRKPRFDRDNNPPGPRGGAGTNWENKPGPRGGPGTSPDRRPNNGAGGRPHHSGQK